MRTLMPFGRLRTSGFWPGHLCPIEDQISDRALLRSLLFGAGVGEAGLISSPRSGSPEPASTTPRTESRSCTIEARSVPVGRTGLSILTLIGVHRGNH